MQRAGRHGAREGAKRIYILILRQQKQATVSHTGHSVSIGDVKAHLHSVTLPPTRPHLLQQGHTYFNKATPPNSANPYGLNIQTYQTMGATPSQTT